MIKMTVTDKEILATEEGKLLGKLVWEQESIINSNRQKYVVTRNVNTVTATNVVESATNYQYTNSSDPFMEYYF